MNSRPAQIMIGIDPGQQTGMAISRDGCLEKIATTTLVAAMDRVDRLLNGAATLKVVLEDPRQYTAFGGARNKASRRYGAGYVVAHRDAWVEFCEIRGIPIQLVAPYHNKTKLNAQRFHQITGWKQPTSVHGRDAAMLIFGMRIAKAPAEPADIDPYLNAYTGIVY